MVSATGYAGPTAEQLRAAARVPAYGRQLVEVFSLRLVGGAAGAPPCGTVSVSDGKRGQVVYSRERDQPTRFHPSSRAQDGLVLTGPHRAISADGSVAITLDLDDGSQEPPPSSQEGGNKTGKISWDVYHPSVEHDKAISQTVDTRCGPAEVTYAVLSNAVEGVVEVKLVHGEDGGPACVRGRITARSRLFEVGIVLFDSESDESVLARARLEGLSTIPLARSVLAVPLAWPLTVEADLRARSGDEIAKGYLEFYPELDGQHVKRLVGRNGEIEVKITWWDN
ncbi:60 kDa jasmonate-induced protein-like [Phragmites australis]|uniref:60 kDa jasmonate-induced protein-like n=1 Tax=Phragmites australis TaxID=29695 RepID=UPI002D771FAB|nr:60 kDa jasmonate-induced protein-like [Phragmites australis]